jgi:hypothetical protein
MIEIDGIGYLILFVRNDAKRMKNCEAIIRKIKSEQCFDWWIEAQFRPEGKQAMADDHEVCKLNSLLISCVDHKNSENNDHHCPGDKESRKFKHGLWFKRSK